MNAAMKPPGLLQGKFIFKKLPDGNLDKTKVVCTLCNAQLVYCKSSSSLKYHLKAKHPLANADDAGQSTDVALGNSRRRTMFECNRGKPLSTALSDKTAVSNAPRFETTCACSQDLVELEREKINILKGIQQTLKDSAARDARYQEEVLEIKRARLQMEEKKLLLEQMKFERPSIFFADSSVQPTRSK